MSTIDHRSGIEYANYIIEITKAQMRWRMAFRALHFVRIMLSLPKQIILSKTDKCNSYSETLLSHSSHVIEVETNSSSSHSQQYEHNKLSSEEDIFVPQVDHHILMEMVKEKDLVSLRNLGSVGGIAKSLGTDPEKGITDANQAVNKRREMFGSNTYHKPPPKGFFYFVVDALKDTTILILLVCAALSLGFGIKEHGAEEGWYEGGSIFIAVLLVIIGSALSNFRQETQFHKLSKIGDNIKIDVVRSGRRQEISIFDIVVGDVVLLNIGDQIPADGLFLSGHSLLVDESSMTGESDHIEIDSNAHPFLFSGSKVADGYGKMLVTSVGMNTTWGEMMSSITRDTNERTPLQARLDKLTSSIGKVGLTVAFLVLVVMLVRYFTGNTEDDDGKREYNGSKTSVDDILNSVVNIVAAAVTIIVVAIPEGLPLAVTLTLAYSMKRMMADHAMVRKLSACETMGSATVICTDKTGTLTLNQMKVTNFWLGQEQIDEDSSNEIATNVREMFYQGVGLNTTGSVYKPDQSNSEPEFSGSPTEKAILSWAVLNLGMDMEKLKLKYKILHVETFNSEKKRSGVMLRENANNKIYVHWKGAAEILVAMCSSYYDSNGIIKSLDEEVRKRIGKIIEGMAASSLRCIAFAQCQVSEEEMEYSEEEKTHRRLKEEGLALLGIVGLKDPCRLGVKKAVEACKSAGVAIKMITGDNVFTAKAIAAECGILEYGDCWKDKTESHVLWTN